MVEMNVAVDLYSILVCATLLSYFCFSHGGRKKMNRWFVFMILSNIGMLAGDMPDWLCSGIETGWSQGLLWLGSIAYFCCSAPLLLSFTGYVIEYLHPKVCVPPLLWRLTVLLAGAQVVLALSSPLTGLFFTVGAGNVYQRGSLFLLSQAIPFVMYVIAGIVILRYRRHLRAKELCFFLSYIFLPIAAEVVQILFRGVALVNAAATLSLLLIFINIQSEQSLLLKQKEQELTEMRIDIMLSQIQPHFLYNTLTAIRQLCDIDTEQAKQSIFEFSRFLRANMDSLTNKELICFDQELEHLRNYLHLEQQRFGKRLKVVYDIQARDFKLPTLSLQPLAENAVRHGIVMREEGGTLLIRSEESGGEYRVALIDDGVGFDGCAADGDERVHIGVENVRRRLSMQCGGTLRLESIPGTGTTATIILPKEEKPDETARSR